MNKSKKMRQMRRFLLRYGHILEEGPRPPEPNFPPYRKGSYYIDYDTFDGDAYSCGDENKYKVYKLLYTDVKNMLNSQKKK